MLRSKVQGLVAWGPRNLVSGQILLHHAGQRVLYWMPLPQREGEGTGRGCKDHINPLGRQSDVRPAMDAIASHIVVHRADGRFCAPGSSIKKSGGDQRGRGQVSSFHDPELAPRPSCPHSIRRSSGPWYPPFAVGGQFGGYDVCPGALGGSLPVS